MCTCVGCFSTSLLCCNHWYNCGMRLCRSQWLAATIIMYPGVCGCWWSIELHTNYETGGGNVRIISEYAMNLVLLPVRPRPSVRLQRRNNVISMIMKYTSGIKAESSIFPSKFHRDTPMRHLKFTAIRRSTIQTSIWTATFAWMYYGGFCSCIHLSSRSNAQICALLN